MGLGGISPFQLLIVLAIVLVLFGGKRLRSLGGDLGGAIKGFRSAMKDGEKDEAAREAERLAERLGEPTRPADTDAVTQRERHDG
ncbi:MAG: Sec-independent protein translocase subunit TatA [Immundisolibacter sp.]|uniref:Sec-independent protein translocase subunit TatA n=1 Tax=Immundisolibacter sp. TaxID=1934948 RepID=UPI003EE208C0